ncbi:hypothetical protein [Streptomyces sp. NPDC101166]|uniref:hypothetical protein n=1 Tax=Streptomyces sp. NPDC101166 TaxID=3366120 RepID=UPI0037FA2654
MTGRQLTLDDALPEQPPAVCDPVWTDCQPTRRTPTPADLRRAELSDLRGQEASVYGLYTADTVPTGHYL